ncbi:MAG: hypothetical protein J6L24_04075 [Oscillospiraceae bacterium]|nr:hypothetical protein [Oscillospiraceae bacterium]
MKTREKMKFSIKLLIAMGIYAAVFIAAAAFGLRWFWNYMAAYEASRPQTAMDTYMEQLEIGHLQDSAADLIAGIDHNIQSEDSCRQAIADAVSTDITYAKKVSECTDTQLVYILSCGKQAIGRVTLIPGETDSFGYTPWIVGSESFDFSYLIGEGASVTVPHNYPVYVNGVCLSGEYITETGIRYALLDDFYDDYSLPCMVTYEVAPILGTLNVTITDPQGIAVSPEEALDELSVLNNCTEAERADIESVTEAFLTRYVAFITNANGDLKGNYTRLAKYMVPGSSLDQRMHDSFEGLKWVRDRKASLKSMTIQHRVSLGNGCYLCDVTYTVKYSNSTVITDSVQIIFRDTDSGLLAETLRSY